MSQSINNKKVIVSGSKLNPSFYSMFMIFAAKCYKIMVRCGVSM